MPVLSAAEGIELVSSIGGPAFSGGESPIWVRVRADALPEHTRYRDDGCDVHPHCLTCPLPRCRYAEPGGLRALLNARRDCQIVEMRLQGVPVDDLAWRFGVSRRTVFRVLESRVRNGHSGHKGTGATYPEGRASPAGQADRRRHAPEAHRPPAEAKACPSGREGQSQHFSQPSNDPDLHSTKEALHA